MHQIVKLVNLKFMQQKKLDSYTLDLEVFPEFVVQLAYKCYSRRPQDLRGQYVGLMVDALFNLVASSMKQRNENPNIILDPDQLFVRGDVRLIKELNYQLMEDPEMEIPPDYAKYKSKDLFVDYRLGEEIQAAVGGAYATCYELLADILHEQLDIRVAEPITTLLNVVRVKPKPIPVTKRLYDADKQKQLFEQAQHP